MSNNPILEPTPIKATEPVIINPSTTSKKRTHEEISPVDEEMGGTLLSSKTPGISPTGSAGEEMADINPLTGAATTTETQSGTWFEDQLKNKLHSEKGDTSVQTVHSDDESPRKLRRRDASHTDVPDAGNRPEFTESRKVPVANPIIDQYTRQLGIGWISLAGDSDLNAMAMGFGRYINNRYPLLTNAVVSLKSKSLDSYLVVTDQGFYIFPEDLQQGRQVAKTWENTLVNLLSRPIRFSGEEPHFAVGSPPEKERENDDDTAASAKAVQEEDTEMETTKAVQEEDAEMEMEMD